MNISKIDRYLHDLDHALAGVPSATRQSILDDMRAHADDAIESGRDPEAVIEAFGTPESVAQSAREELGISDSPQTVSTAENTRRALHWASLMLAVVSAIFVTFLLPLYTTATEVSDSGGLEESVYAASTLFEALGIGVGLLPLLPAAVVLLPLVLPARMRAIAGWAAAVVVSVGSVVAGFTIGGFFIPLALLLWGAMFVPLWIQRGSNSVSGRVWRIAGALILFIPATFAFGGLVTGTLQDPSPAFWIAAIVITAMTVLFALRVPFIDWIVAAFGAAIMLLSVFDGGMLLLALWWAGGTWLTIGLCGAFARRAARATVSPR